MKKNAKSKRTEAERAAEHYAIKTLGCYDTIRAVRTKFQHQDLRGGDVIGFNGDGDVIIQVTAGQDSAVTARRRKLEKIMWRSFDRVLLLQLVQTEDPGAGRKKLWWFRVHEYRLIIKSPREWITHEAAVPIPREWFKAYKNQGALNNYNQNQ